MKVITVSYAGNVEGVICLNTDDDAEKAAEEIRRADEDGELYVQVHEPDTLLGVLDYVRNV